MQSQTDDTVSSVKTTELIRTSQSWDGEGLQFFSKECFSNGCMGTVDVTYPSIPLFLLYNPDLICGMLDPVFRFADTDAWPFEFAPHDVGQYPLANGQVYGYRARDRHRGSVEDFQMPVEECGNMLLCTVANGQYVGGSYRCAPRSRYDDGLAEICMGVWEGRAWGDVEHEFPEQMRYLLDEDKCKATEHRYGKITGKYVIYRGEGCAVDGVQYLNVEDYLKRVTY